MHLELHAAVEQSAMPLCHRLPCRDIMRDEMRWQHQRWRRNEPQEPGQERRNPGRLPAPYYCPRSSARTARARGPRRSAATHTCRALGDAVISTPRVPSALRRGVARGAARVQAPVQAFGFVRGSVRGSYCLFINEPPSSCLLKKSARPLVLTTSTGSLGSTICFSFGNRSFP